MDDEATIAELLDRLQRLWQEQAELVAKHQILRADGRFALLDTAKRACERHRKSYGE
jgi:hypothetical protein